MINENQLSIIIKYALNQDHIEILEYMNRHKITYITASELLELFSETDRITNEIWVNLLPHINKRYKDIIYCDTDSFKIKEDKDQ